MNDDVPGLTVQWSTIYHPEWDDEPGVYVESGLVGWGQSRRLARADDAARGFKAYLGVRHFDAGRWNLPGEPAASFFLSLFLHGRTVSMHTYPSLGTAREALERFHAAILGRERTEQPVNCVSQRAQSDI